MNIEEILAYISRWVGHLAVDVLESVFILIVLIERGLIPWWHWPVVVAALVYFVSPIDAAPDPIFIDDAGVLATAIAALGSVVTDEVRREARLRAETLLGLKRS